MSVRIKLNSAGVRQLLRSAELQADLKRRGEKVASAAGGEGYEAELKVGRTRASVTVVAVTGETMRKEARTRGLIRALGSGR